MPHADTVVKQAALTLPTSVAKLIVAGCIIDQIERSSICHLLCVQLIKHAIE